MTKREARLRVYTELFEPVLNFLHFGAPSHAVFGQTYPIEGLLAISGEVFCGWEWLALPLASPSVRFFAPAASPTNSARGIPARSCIAG